MTGTKLTQTTTVESLVHETAVQIVENFTGFQDHSIHVFKWDFDHVAAPFIINGFIFALVLIRIAYQRISKLAEVIPESCTMIMMGVVLGAIMRFTIESDVHWRFLRFESTTFFLILLPPIMLEAAYSLRDRAFWSNLGTILIYAVLGTILNILLIGVGIWSLSLIGIVELNFLEACIFSSLISAVDPVAVLAIFEEVGVNKGLYFMVFGESLLNDAVVIVIYNLMIGLHKIGIDNIVWGDVGMALGNCSPVFRRCIHKNICGLANSCADFTDCLSNLLLGLASFFSVSCGAIVIGLAWGIFASFVTKYTTMIRIVEPVIIIATAYSAYLTAEMVHFSGIISIICCGIMQAQFASENLSVKSYITIQFSVKCISQVMESLIFIIVGVMLVNDTRVWEAWNTAYCLCALFIVIIVRFIVTFGLTSLVNHVQHGFHRISFKEQFIIGYGGLRGAIAFSLCFMLGADAEEGDLIDEEYNLPLNTIRLFLCATYFVLLFTVFVQGISMKPIVKLLGIDLHDEHADEEFEMFAEFHRTLISNMLAGVEEIIGHRGGYYWTMIFTWFSHMFFHPLVQTRPSYMGKSLVELDEHLHLKHTIPQKSRVGKPTAILDNIDNHANQHTRLSNRQAMNLFKEDTGSVPSKIGLKNSPRPPPRITRSLSPAESAKLCSRGDSNEDTRSVTEPLLIGAEAAETLVPGEVNADEVNSSEVRITFSDHEADRPDEDDTFSSKPTSPKISIDHHDLERQISIGIRRDSHRESFTRGSDIQALKFALPRASMAQAISKRMNILDEPIIRHHRFERKMTLGGTEQPEISTIPEIKERSHSDVSSVR